MYALFLSITYGHDKTAQSAKNIAFELSKKEI